MELIAGGAIAGSVIIYLLRSLFFILDAFVYSLCGGFFRIAMSMYDINSMMNTSELLTRFADLIYSFLAIFMFFKIAFSLLQMLVDPSQIDDKQKGAGKIVQNVFVCLLLIAIVPSIFTGARKIQTIIIEDQVIEKAIYGEGFEKEKYSNVGHKLAIASWSIFLHPNDTMNEDAIAKQKWEKAFDIDNAANTWEVLGDLALYLNFKSLLVVGRYHISYMWGISTIFGIYLLWTFIKLAIDVAYRSLKLLILQLISPIAIVSYIDPKSGKDGIFAKWTKECVKTYVSLFVRLFIYAIASVILIEFTKNINSNATLFDFDAYKKITYLLAILALIKSGPKMFDSIFGTEISKESETKAATDMLRGLYGAGAGALTGGITGGVIAKRATRNVAKGAIGGAWSGIKKGYSAGQKGSIPGMVGAITGTYGDAIKKYGVKKDKEKEDRVKKQEDKVEEVDKRKSERAAELSENNNKEASKIIAATKNVNGRKYGGAVQDDEQLINAVKKNQGGLEKDMIIHKDIQNFDDYKKYREQQAEMDMAATVVQRTLDKANYDFQTQQGIYSNLGTDQDRQSYIANLAGMSAKNMITRIEVEMGEAKAMETITKDFTSLLNNSIKSALDSYNKPTAINIIAKATGLNIDDVSKYSDEQLRAQYDSYVNQSYGKVLSDFNNSSKDKKLDIYASHISEKEKVKISNYNSVQLNEEFTDVNDKNIVATYGNSLNNMTSDAGKIKGDADAAKAALEEFLKGDKGKGHSDVDSDYKIAEGNVKARKSAENKTHPWEDKE